MWEVTVWPSEFVVVTATVVGTDVLLCFCVVSPFLVVVSPSDVVPLSSDDGELLVVPWPAVLLVLGVVDGEFGVVEGVFEDVTPVPATCRLGMTPSGNSSAPMVAKPKMKASMTAALERGLTIGCCLDLRVASNAITLGYCLPLDWPLANYWVQAKRSCAFSGKYVFEKQRKNEGIDGLVDKAKVNDTQEERRATIVWYRCTRRRLERWEAVKHGRLNLDSRLAELGIACFR
jgi:hypothetical protein